MSPAERVKRNPTCWRCKTVLYSDIDRRCEVCGGLICSVKGCRACFCEYLMQPEMISELYRQEALLPLSQPPQDFTVELPF